MSVVASAFPVERRVGSRVLAVALALCLLGAVHWLSAPRIGDHAWSDSPRHLLNAVLVRDAFRTLPFDSPMQWAKAYYDQYPALTIGFYPPGFATALGAWFLAFGASHAAAQAFVSLCYVVLVGATGYVVARISRPIGGLAAATLLASAPELLLWSRQIQPEVPSLALVALSLVAALGYGASGSTARLYTAVLLFAASLYVKQTALVLLPLLLIVLLRNPSRPFRAPRPVARAVALFALALVPLAAFQLRFGRENLRSVQGIPDAPFRLGEVGNWIWYALRADEVAGWALLIATLAGFVAILPGGSRRQRRFTFALAGLAIVIYVLFSVIALKEQRHILPILLPLSMIAGLGTAALAGWLARRRHALRLPLPALGASLFVGVSIAINEVPEVRGPAQAARQVLEAAAGPCVVLAHLKDDGSFIAALRLDDPDRRCTVLRSDKLLFDVTIRREMGLRQRSIDAEAIRRFIHDHGVRYVVIDPDFWSDLANTQTLLGVIDPASFERIAVTQAEPEDVADGHVVHRRRLEVHVNRQAVREPPLRWSVAPSM
jgi:4-amino-4-deoxy-L-arabinose transferase-like glycosyltransferase